MEYNSLNQKSRVIDSYAIKPNRVKRPLGAKIKSFFIAFSFLLLVASIAALSAYSIIMTQLYKETKPIIKKIVTENKKKQKYIEKYSVMTEKINKDLCLALDKNNELRKILGIEAIPLNSLTSIKNQKPKTEKDYISHNEFVTLLKNIRPLKTSSNNMEIGKIFIGEKEILSFVTPVDSYYGAHFRTDKILQRIRKIIYDREVYDKIIIKELEQDEYGILINDRLIFTVTKFDADFEKTNLKILARKRARSLHNAMLDFNRDYILAYIKEKIKNDKERKSTEKKKDIVEEKLSNLSSALEKLNKESIAMETTTHRYFQRYKSTPSISPLKGKISSGFGYRKSPFSGKLKLHEGVDILAMTGTPVKATADGYITHAGWYIGYGHFVQINHGYGMETRYGHLSKINVRKGQFVKKGSIIAYSGNSGLSTGPHLHYEVRNFKKPVNPISYVNLDIYSVKTRW